VKSIVRVLGSVLAILALGGLAQAFKVQQSYNATDRRYSYTVEVEAADAPLRDFHLIPAKKGQKLKGGMDDPVKLPGMQMTQWKTAKKNPKSGGKCDGMSWYTADADVGGEGDTETRDDPIPAGSTARFSVLAPPRHQSGDVIYFCTTDGSSTPPPPPPSPTPVPGPVATVTPTATTETPGRNSVTALTLESTEIATPWAVYLAASLSDPGDPATDPMGIGINTNDPIPAEYGIAVSPASGTFGSPPEPALPTASSELSVGNAPVGYRFYLVLVGRDELGEIELWSDPIAFVVSAQ